jgi:outer membrane protein OmpA-like peptidoglycan-associated protein
VPNGSIKARWASYRVITFGHARSELSAADPSLQLGLDGFNDPDSPRLSERRVGTVREALIAAGVPPSNIQVGAFGDPQLRTDRRVEMLLSTGSAPGSQSMKT